MSERTGYWEVMDAAGFMLFGLAQAFWAIAAWQGPDWQPQPVLDRIEMTRIACEVGGAITALLGLRFWLATQAMTGAIWPGVGLVLVVIEGARRLWRVGSSSTEETTPGVLHQPSSPNQP